MSAERAGIATAGLLLAATLTACALERVPADRTVQPSPASVSAAELAAGHWSSIPPAPIVPRSNATSAWIGTEMLVWGGASGTKNDHCQNDGAAYNPTTRRWTKLPASPLSARRSAVSTWTGSKWFIWGGYTTYAGSTWAVDGAVFDPQTEKWEALPSIPLTDVGTASAVWTGSSIVVVSQPSPRSSMAAQAASFDPGTGRWTRLADLPMTIDHDIEGVSALAVGPRVFAWSKWGHTTAIGKQTYTTVSGVDAFVLEPGATTWAPTQPPPDRNSPDGALWTGSTILIPAARTWCAGCSGPPKTNLAGVLIDPVNKTATRIAHGPVDDLNANYIWTGNALLAYDTSTYISGPTTPSTPGKPRSGTHAPVCGPDCPTHPAAPTASQLLSGREPISSSGASASPVTKPRRCIRPRASSAHTESNSVPPTTDAATRRPRSPAPQATPCRP